MNPIDQLKSVLCGPEGKCCIAGSDEDRSIVDRALQALAESTPVQEPVSWGVDWGSHGDRSCVSIVKQHANGTLEVIATEYGPAGSAPQAQQPAPPADVPMLDDDWIIDMANEVHRAMPAGSDEQDELLAVVREAEKELRQKVGLK